ncbi:MAG: hypothetical protein KIT16_16175 [Rhodospirillaceae bacterium]|nr:hypothetical protein [Rhodospirillaceae bacterium]
MRRWIGWAAALIAPLASAAVFAAAPASAQGAGDRLIVANQRVGAVRVNSTAARLRRVYGAKNVQAGKFETGEGSFDGIVLFPNTDAAIRLYSSEDKKRIATVEIGAQKGPWHTREGLRIGSNLADLEKANGGPFTLMRTEQEGGGWVVDRASAPKLPKVGFQLLGDGTLSDAEQARLSKMRRVRSNDPLARKSRLAVYKIFVTLGRP